MKIYIRTGILVLLSIIVVLSASAQEKSETSLSFNSMNHWESSDSTDSKSDTDSDQILVPINDQGWVYTYATDTSSEFIQTGLYADRYGIGGEFTLSSAEHGYYTRIFAGSMANPSHEALLHTNNNSAWAGLTIGLETVLHSFSRGSLSRDDLIRTDIDGIQFYGRAGPGVGISTASRNSLGSSETRIGMHAEMTVGVRLKLFHQTAIYIETGALAGYFPTASEMNLIGTPQLKIGFSFFRNQGILPFRF